MTFYLGTHMPSWLRFLPVPLFVSRRRLARSSVGRSAAPWALDSGGFSELSMYGRWTVEAARYSDEVMGWMDRPGRLDFAAIQDWMCEPSVLARTGRSIREHQDRTVASCLELRALAPAVPWLPVLQGWDLDDYHRHVESYRSAGIDLRSCPAVGVGSICRRQATAGAESILRSLAALGLRLHAFGFKVQGLRRVADVLASADSMAWSAAARRDGRPLPGCSGHVNCANCHRYATLWRSRLMEAIRPCPATL